MPRMKAEDKKTPEEIEKIESETVFNYDLKKDFLSKISFGTQNMYWYVLKKVSKIAEMEYQKDVCNFNYDEFTLLLSGLKAKSLNSLYTQLSIITKYIDFAIPGYSQTGINYGYSFTGSETLEKYVSKSYADNKYITFEQITEIIEFCDNPQDAICFALLYYGAFGEELEELTNITVKDVDFKNGIITLKKHIKNNNGILELKTRQIEVPDSIITLIEDAINQVEYKKNNGEELNYTTDATTPPYFKMYPSEYIIRKAGKKDSKPTRGTVADRIRRICADLGYNKLNPTNIWISGMIHYAKQYIAERCISDPSTLERQDYITINKYFGYGEQYWHVTKTRILKFLTDSRFE
jgi:integrase